MDKVMLQKEGNCICVEKER